MAFIGVRISWLMFARNMDFISVASSAFCLAPTSSSACSSSWRACACVWPSSSCVRRLRCRISRLIATTGSNSSSSDFSCVSNGRKDATSSTPSSASLDKAGSATACTGAASPRARGDAEIIGREIRERDRLPLLRTLADQPLAEAGSAGRDGVFRKAVRGDRCELAGAVVEHVERRDAAAQHRHEAREQPLAELRERAPHLAALP